ncbi:MAG: ECF RNA polymerase sigma factor SigE [Pseudomonadales bacterium]|nr:ECF RNA polymerase sigma factor SigE [Pseudomonadales bacterium]
MRQSDDSDADDATEVAADLETFLRSIERRGFLMARFALGNEDDALDALQDTMLRLVQRYAGRPPAEWRPLFYRMLRNRITDTRRRRVLHARLFGWMERSRDEHGEEPLARIADPAVTDPARLIAGEETADTLMQAVARLPERQRQAFLLRCWEGLSTAETAAAMGCGEGSVKTHYSRALQALREQLGDHR